MIKGLDYDFGGKILTIPPLSLGSLEILEDDMAALATASQGKQATITINILFEALKRNYPEMTRAEVANLVDIRNMKDIIPAVTTVSGLVATTESGNQGK